MNVTLQKGTILHKRYEIVKALGAGDFGTVYQARDTKAVNTPRYVAIKQMPMQMIVDCERQADLRATLIHPSIPRVFDYFVTDTHSYLVRELVRGSNLEEILDSRKGFLKEKIVIHWTIQLCGALEVLHTHPVHPMVFRDLKPNNIMVNSANRVSLVDFELARVFPPRFFEENKKEFSHFKKGFPIGTKGYSPPEQYRGIVTPPSDVYALGATLHHLLTRRDPRKEKPFTFQNYPVRTLNPAVSKGMEAIVMKAVQRKPNHRFWTAREMRQALEAL
ncbi:MAG TPA: serine/threonine-protein kinase [Anaerolineales bacterium]|nr:serine/threonine-protein kinase [Anaerolineales bacterium]